MEYRSLKNFKLISKRICFIIGQIWVQIFSDNKDLICWLLIYSQTDFQANRLGFGENVTKMCLYICCLLSVTKAAFPLGFTRPLKMCCGIWHQSVSSRSFESCKLQGGPLWNLTYFCSISHRRSIGVQSWNTSNSLLFSSHHSRYIFFILMKHAHGSQS